jgi:transglutaminase-like putative cysteine protease
MNLHVRHSLHYEYTDGVWLEPHTVYLHPKAYPHQQIRSYSLSVSPEPSMKVENIDAEGNRQQILYFKDATQSLVFEAEIVVQSDSYNVFEFVLFPFETERLPFSYPTSIHIFLQSYLLREGVTTYIDQYARQTAAAARWSSVQFLTDLCANISTDFIYEQRQTGAPLSAEATLISRKGTCRDFAVLYMACCRALGIAARFASGYLFGSPTHAHDLHAWAEVYLPGAGWRGFDPTEGKAVSSNHITLATSANPTAINPVSGTFRGRSRSELRTQVKLLEIT